MNQFPLKNKSQIKITRIPGTPKNQSKMGTPTFASKFLSKCFMIESNARQLPFIPVLEKFAQLM
jgi:hypothetical protein